MMSSIASSTLKQYLSHMKGWLVYCCDRKLNPFSASISEVLTYLTKKFHDGMSYGSLNSLRSALSLMAGSRIGSNDQIKRLFKGFFRLRPNKPKYSFIWDTSIVLDYIENNYNDFSNLEICSKKTVILLLLATGQRAQTICSIEIDQIKVQNNVVYIMIPNLIKTSAPNRYQPLLTLPFFNNRPSICPAQALTNYLQITKNIRNDCKRLFVSYKKPHKAVTVSTISRWVKGVLQESGIDVSIFSAHSTRHASTSAALQRGVSLDEIRRSAGWTGSSNCFAKFYNRPVQSNDNNVSFADAVFLE